MKISLSPAFFLTSKWRQNSVYSTLSNSVQTSKSNSDLTSNSDQTSKSDHTHLMKSIGNQTQMNDYYSLMQLVDISVSSKSTLQSSSLFIQLADIELCNSVIRSYSLSNKHLHSLFVYQQMRKIGVAPDLTTFPILIKSVGRLYRREFGELIHGSVIRMGFNVDVFINTSLVHVYCLCSLVEDASKLFDEMPVRNSVSWNAFITGLTYNGMFRDAINVFWEMELDGAEPVEVTVSSVLSACAHIGALRQGKMIHDYILQKRIRIRMDVAVGSSLIDMYAKCGAIEEGEKVFKAMRVKNVYTWNILIMGLATNGRGDDALHVFDKMVRENYMPDRVTFLGVLCACCHQGLINEGRLQFLTMTQRYRLEPNIEHYGCMVDLLARAGSLDEAHWLIQKMHIRPDPAVWRALAIGCRMHKNTKLGESAMMKLIELEPNKGENYTMLEELYARKKMWEKAAKVREMMDRRGIKKVSGCSSIEIDNLVYEFTASDVNEPGLEEVYLFLAEMKKKLTMSGYLVHTDTVGYDIEEEEKELSLIYHSEKLALAFGILKSHPEITLRIIKTSSMICLDCHSFFKLISKAYGRNITVRDGVRFHYFVGGCCSCKDYVNDN